MKTKDNTEKVRELIAKNQHLNEVYKMGFNQSATRAVDAKPPQDMFNAIKEILKAKEANQKVMIKTIFPLAGLAGAVFPRFSLEDGTGKVFASGEQTGLGMYVVRALSFFSIGGTKITAAELSEQLFEVWSHSFSYTFESKAATEVIERAPTRETVATAKGKGKGKASKGAKY